MKLRLLLLFFVSYLSVAGEAVWNAANGFAGCKAGRNLEIEKTAEGLKLHLTAVDPQLAILEANLIPADFTTVSFTYRATGTGNRNGQFYFSDEKGTIIAERCWQLNPPIADSKWHTVTIDCRTSRIPREWNSIPVVKQLRFDPTDAEGGTLELKEIRFFYLPEHSDSYIPPDKVWNKETGFAGWKALAHCNISPSAEGLKAELTEVDSQIEIATGILNTTKFNTITYTYRAGGTGASCGQFYFPGKDGQIVAATCWRIPELNPDGQWHTVTLTYRELRDAGLWHQSQTISRLRFDPSDSGGGWIEIKELRIACKKENVPPESAFWKLPETKAQLDTEPWPDVQPQHVRPVPRNVTKHAYFQAKMISSPKDLRGQSTYSNFYLRRSFQLKAKPAEAWLQFVADDGAEAFLNGQKAATCDFWKVTVCQEVTQFLKKGANALGFHYRNTNSAGGVFGELFVQYADGTFERFSTDDKFLTSCNAPENWCLAETKSDGWEPVVTKPGPPNPPWTTKLRYIDFSSSSKCRSLRLSSDTVQAGGKVRVMGEFDGKRPELPMEVTLLLKRNGRTCWEEEQQLKEDNTKVLDASHWQLSLELEVPLYFSSKEVELSLESPALRIGTEAGPVAKLAIQGLKAVPGYEKKPVFKVEQLPGGTGFTLNGHPFYALWGALQAWRRQDRLPIHGTMKPNLVTVYVDANKAWPALGETDTDAFDLEVEKYRRCNPGAYFMMDIPVYPPWTFDQEYAEEMCRDDWGQVNRDGRICYSLFSKKARELCMIHMERCIRYLESCPYANRIVGYRIVGGHTIEWLGWDPKPGRTLDFSKPAQEAFREYLKQNYPEIQDATVPSLAEREVPVGEDILWEPKEHLKAVAYHRFYSDGVTDMPIALCTRARELIGKDKVLATYNGYTMTLPASGRSQIRAHYSFRKFLDSKCVDIVMSPQPYRVRNLGDIMGDMKPFSTILANGMIPVIEDDTRTSNCAPGYGYYQLVNRYQDIQILRRNYSTVLCRNTPAFFYSLSAGTEYDFPEAATILDTIRVTGQHCLEKGVRRNAEVAIVVSEEMVKMMPMLRQAAGSRELIQSYNDEGRVLSQEATGCVYMGDALERNYIKYACTGMPVDYVLAEDLAAHPGNYKLYIFANCICYDEAFLKAVEKLRQRDCTLFWMYAPGYTFQDRNSLENMARLTGMNLQKAGMPLMPALEGMSMTVGCQTTRVSPMFTVEDKQAEALGTYENGAVAFARKRTGAATTYFCGVWQFPVPFLMTVFRKAGLFAYSDSDDPLEANGALVVLHAKAAGHKTIRFPRRTDVLDVFQRSIVARNADSWSYDAKLHQSNLFYYGDDAEELLRKLNREVPVAPNTP